MTLKMLADAAQTFRRAAAYPQARAPGQAVPFDYCERSACVHAESRQFAYSNTAP
jgi:predicted metal-binding protein